MATVESIGYNSSAVKTQTLVSGDELNCAGGAVIAEGLTVTAQGFAVNSGGASVVGDSSITGNLTVTGNLISQTETQVIVKDNFIDLNVGYVGTSYEQTGLTFNFQAVTDDTQASGTLEVTNNANLQANTSTITLTKADNSTIVFTAKASGATGQEFDIGADVNATATNIANAVNSHPDFSASSNNAVVTVTLATGGASGNGKAIQTNQANAIGNIVNFAGGITRSVISINTGSNTLSFTAGTTTDRAKLSFASAAFGINSFALNDVIQISGTNNGEQDGIYIVHSNSVANEIEIKSSTLSTPDTVNAKFALLDFAETTTTSGTVTIAKVNLLAVRSSSTGTLQQAAGSVDSDFTTYQEVGDDTSLQEAYQAGAVLTTINSTDVVFRLASGDFEIRGGGSLFLGTSLQKLAAIQTNVSTNIDINADSGISIDAGGASNYTTSAGVLTLNGAGGVTINGNAAEVDITTTGAVDINSGAFTVDGSTISIDGSGAGNLTVNDELDIVSSNGNVDIDAAGDILGTAIGGAVTLQAADTSSFTVTGNSNSGTNMSVVAGNNGSGTAAIAIQAKTSIGNTVGGVAKLTISTTATTHNQNVTFDTTGGLNFETETVVINSIKDEDNMTSNSATALATQQSIKAYVDSQISDDNLTFAGDSSSGTVDLDTQTFTIAGTSNEIETSASGQTLTVGLPSAVSITTSLTTPLVNVASIEAQDSTAAMTIANSTGAVGISTTLGLSSGTTVNEFSTDGTLAGDSDDAIPTEKAVKTFVESKTISYNVVSMICSETIAVGDVVSILASGQAVKGNAATSTKQNVIGICVVGNTTGNACQVAQVGLYTQAGAFSAGQRYYLSAASDGALVTSAPSGADQVVFQIGFATTNNDLILQPQFIMLIG